MSRTTDAAAVTAPTKPRRPRRRRSVTESLLSIVLGLEMTLVFFMAIVLAGLRRVDPMTALIGGVGFVVLLVLVTRTLRQPWGAWLGLAAQLAFIAAGFLEPLMFLIGAGFAAMYAYFFAKGRQLDERNARVLAHMTDPTAEGA